MKGQNNMTAISPTLTVHDERAIAKAQAKRDRKAAKRIGSASKYNVTNMDTPSLRAAMKAEGLNYIGKKNEAIRLILAAITK